VLDNTSLKSKVALLASGAIFAAAAIGIAARGGGDHDASLLVTGSDTETAEVSDLSIDVGISTRPTPEICTSWLEKAERLPAGCPLVISFTVTNDADTPATNVILTAPSPKGWDPTITTTSGECLVADGEHGALSCYLGTLAPHASQTIVLDADSTDATMDSRTLTAVASVESDGIDRSPESATEAVIIRIVPQADLSVTLDASDASLIPGEEATFTAHVTNDGPSVARNVRIYQAVTDPLSADFTDVKVVTSSGAPDGSCKGEFEQNNSTARCKVEELAPGETITMVVTATVASDLDTAGEPVEVGVGVSSETADTNNSNNNATATITTAASSSDLSIGITGPHSVATGERATWTVTVEDLGPSDSPNTRVNLNIPSNLKDVLVTSERGVCDLSGCDLGTLRATLDPNMPGNNVNIAITGTSTAPGSFDLGAVATSDNDSSTAPDISQYGDGAWEAATAAAEGPDNVASFTVTVDPALAAVQQDDEPQADIVLSDFTITPLDKTYTGPGSLRNIRFTATNNGPDPAQYPWFRLTRSTDATTDLTDYPDAAGLNAWIDKMCQTTPREIMCALTDAEYLGVGESVTVDYNIALARMGRPGNYTDYVYAYSQTHDPNEANNYGHEDIVVGEGRSALKLTAVALDTERNAGSPGTPGSVAQPNGHDSFVAGAEFAYQITVEVPDAHMADATGVTVTAQLPMGFSATSARTASGQCSIDGVASEGQTVTCQIPVVAAVPTASSTQITVSGHVNQNANDIQFGDKDTDSWAEDVPMVVTASSTTPTKDGSDNTATTTVNVDIIESADLRLYVTPDQAGNLDSDTVGYTLFALNVGPSGVEHAAFTAVIPEGYAFDAAASNCVAPTNSEMDLDLDGIVDLVPTTTGFTVGAENAVVCKANLMRSDVYGNLAAGQAGSARIVLTRIPGAAAYGDNVEIVVGSLAPDPDVSNNVLNVSTAPPTRLMTLSAAHPNGLKLAR